VLQDALVLMDGLMESMDHVGVSSVAPAISVVGGGIQTPATHTLEHMAHGYHL